VQISEIRVEPLRFGLFSLVVPRPRLKTSGLPYRRASLIIRNMLHDNNKSQHPLRRLKSSIHDLQERHRDRHRPTGFGFVFADPLDEDMSVWLRHRVPALNWVLRGLLGGMPHAEAPEQNPFKSTMNGADRTDTIRASRHIAKPYNVD